MKDVYSVSHCISEDFTDYVNFWQHNGFWLFNSPEEIREVATERTISLAGTSLFYYEAYEVEFDGKRWLPYAGDPVLRTDVVLPGENRLDGFDVVTYSMHVGPECSPLSCNSLAEFVPTNAHCLLSSFEDAEERISNGTLILHTEPGPFRIFAVYSIPSWRR